jgi:hypothetical protein
MREYGGRVGPDDNIEVHFAARCTGGWLASITICDGTVRLKAP